MSSLSHSARRILSPALLVTATILTIGLIAVVLAASETNRPLPQFALEGGDQGRVVPVHYPLWRRFGDELLGRKYAVLTFDDGPFGQGVDEKILDVLQRHHAHAMFFVVCAHADPGREHVLSEIVASGNLVENHSEDHAHLLKLGAAGLRREIAGCSARIAQIVGHRPGYFRPPFGDRSPGIQQMAKSAGMRQMLWDANSEDSWLRRPDQVIYWSLEETDNGSILLMHDKPATAQVLDRVLTSLESHGFRFVLPVDPGARSAGWASNPSRARGV